MKSPTNISLLYHQTNLYICSYLLNLVLMCRESLQSIPRTTGRQPMTKQHAELKFEHQNYQSHQKDCGCGLTVEITK